MLRLRSWRKSAFAKLKEIALDYKSGAEGTLEASKERPVRAVLYTGCTIFGIVAFKTTPSEKKYIAALVESSNEMLLCGSERSRATDDYLQNILRIWAKDMLRYRHCGLFSIIYSSDHSKNTKSFKATCKYSNPRWGDFKDRIIDIGFLSRWWRLSYAMTDYDVDFDDVPKQYKNFFYEYVDYIRTALGYSYFSDLRAQPLRGKIYVETIANNDEI